MQLYFTTEHQGTEKVGRHDAMMMERSGCWIGERKGGQQKSVSDWNQGTNRTLICDTGIKIIKQKHGKA